MLKLLDTTLRDGSYVVDFQFTREDTAVLAAALDSHGVHYIEVGHGMGLGASRLARFRAAESDAAYMSAAGSVVRDGRWGMFCIPGIATLEDLDLAAAHGMHFVRIGTNVTETEEATPFIRRARALGLEVFANFMKTYALSPAEVAERAAQVAGDGAQIVCVVDSAGGMLPEDVSAYVTSIRQRLDVAVGYHGHNNLDLAVANTLAAVNAGALVVDTSLRGMGRSAGNASTEKTLFALLRRGIDLGIDPIAMLNIAEQRIDPMIERPNRGQSLDVVTGYAQFHSSYMGLVTDVARERAVDARALIIGVTREDKIDAPRQLVERVADGLQRAPRPERRVSARMPPSPDQSDDLPLEQRLRLLYERVRTAASQRGRPAVLNVVQRTRDERPLVVSPVVQIGREAVIGTVEVRNAEAAASVVAAIEGRVDYILLDSDQKGPLSGAIARAMRGAPVPVLRYSDLHAWRSTVLDMVEASAANDLEAPRLLLVGPRDATLVRGLRADALARGWSVRVTGRHALRLPTSCDAVVICAAGHRIGASNAPRAHHRPLVMDAWVGALQASDVASLAASGHQVLRPDMRAAIQAEFARANAVRELQTDASGYRQIGRLPIAGGGVIPPYGTVIVDSATRPSVVHGLADGTGLLLDPRVLDSQLASRLQDARTLLMHSTT
jgi:4-hydroxy-2-oxovalerate aldolase